MTAMEHSDRELAEVLILVQATAQVAPLSDVQATAMKLLTGLTRSLNDLNTATSVDARDDALSDVLSAAGLAGVFVLGASQRDPAGWRIVWPQVALVN